MTTNVQYDLQRDKSGNTAYCPQPATILYNGTLDQNVVQTLTVPSNDQFSNYSVNFSFEPGSSVWVSYDGVDPDITNLSGSIDTTNAELNPASRMLDQGSVIKFVTTDTSAAVGIMIYGNKY